VHSTPNPIIRGSQATAGGASQEIEQFLAGCLLARNQSEVDLSQFAQEQAENPEVKQFAQQMVQDHQKIIQQLQQVAGNQSGQGVTLTTPNPTARASRLIAAALQAIHHHSAQTINSVTRTQQ